MSIITRIIGWLDRLTRCISSLGALNTYKIFIYGRLSKHDISIALPNSDCFIANGANDLVTSHFYNLGYFINTNKNKSIQSIVDAGANIGVETARFSVHHPNALIISIEANKRNYSYLKNNFKNNSNVHSLHAGLWPTNCDLTVTSTSQDMQAFRVHESNLADNSVNSITVGNILEQFQLKIIDIMKLDIEGAELQLFTRGDTSWINTVNVFIIEIGGQDAYGMTQAIFKAIDGLKFNSYLCGENIVLIRNHLNWTLERVHGFKQHL